MRTKTLRIDSHYFFFATFIITAFFLLNSPFFHMAESTILGESYIDLTIFKAKELIENSTNLFILDVRSESEYEEGHIEGAYLIPHSDIIDRQDELPENKSQPILVYCRLGGRSATASITLDSLNFTQIYNMDGGFDAWKNAGYPIVKPNSNTTVGSTIFQTESSSEGQITSSSTTSTTTPTFDVIFIFQAFGILVLIYRKQRKRNH